MPSSLPLTPGLRGTAALRVGSEHTAPHVGSGRIEVLATPILVNLMEAAALAAVEKWLPAGRQTLGTHLDVTHVAATPVGMRVQANAELVGVEGRRLRFHIVAEDEVETIGEATHERVVVDVSRFDRRIHEKASRLS